MFTLAHISDVHMAPMPRPLPHQLLNQRICGFFNWYALGRKGHHQRATLDALVAHLKTQHYDHLALTGDLVNIALPQEFAASRVWLEALGASDQVSVVPGNHDAYIAAPKGKGIEIWRDYMKVDDTSHIKLPRFDVPEPHTGFPYVRVRENVALVGLSSGIPSRPLLATGALGEAQRDALEVILTTLGQQNLCIVLMIHHPPLPGLAVPFRDLTDAEELSELLSRHQIHLALHGHNHKSELAWGEGPAHRFPVVGVPSASMSDADHRPLGRYNLYDIERTSDTWRIAMRGFAAQNVGGPVGLVEERSLFHGDAEL